ncbi:MAG TPA: diacylglycerol kinase family protein [Sphingomicrobium sp.]|nr:diacylglycerol kinase family protein [Sphingomicrobium sp.]
MSERSPFSVHKRLQSFRYAWAGLRHFAAYEHNGWIHAGATVAVIVASIYFRLTGDEWRWVILAIALVWLSEALNTAIERLADAITLEPNESIGYAKDVAAGAVLAAAIVSVVIGLTIFVPHIADLHP